MVCIMGLVGHWSGCLQFIVPMLNDFPSDSWVAINRLQVPCMKILHGDELTNGLCEYVMDQQSCLGRRMTILSFGISIRNKI